MTRRTSRHFAALDTIVAMAKALWTSVHYSGTRALTETPIDGLGNIAAARPPEVPATGTISEHVLPDAWLSNIFQHIAGLKPLTNRSRADGDDLVRKGAAVSRPRRHGRQHEVRKILTARRASGDATSAPPGSTETSKAEHEEAADRAR